MLLEPKTIIQRNKQNKAGEISYFYTRRCTIFFIKKNKRVIKYTLF